MRQVAAEVFAQHVGLHEFGDALHRRRFRQSVFQRQRAHAVHDREDAALLQVEFAVADDQIVEQADWRLEGLHRLGEARQVDLLGAHRGDQRLLCLRQQVGAAGDGDRIVEDRHVHRRGFVGRCDPAVEVGEIVVERLRPERIAHHHVARTGRKTELLERGGEIGAEAGEHGLVDGLGEDQAIVLIGANRLFLAAFAAHHDQARALAQVRRRQQRERLGDQAPVEIGDDLGDHLDAHVLAPEHAHLLGDLARRDGEVGLGLGAIDAAGDHLRIAGEEAQQIDVLENAGDFLAAPDDDAALVALRHFEQRLEHEIVLVDRHDVEMRERRDRRRDRHGVQHRRLRQVHAGDDADALAVAHQQRIGIDLAHPVARRLDRTGRVDIFGRMQEQVADARAHQRAGVALVLVARHFLQLARHVEIEEGAEPRVAVDEAQRQLFRDQVGERFFARHERVGARALHHRAAVERILRPEQRDQFLAVALLDRALDDDEQRLGRRALRDQRLAGPVIADVDSLAQRVDLVRLQPVEGRIGGVEGLGHGATMSRYENGPRLRGPSP